MESEASIFNSSSARSKTFENSPFENSTARPDPTAMSRAGFIWANGCLRLYEGDVVYCPFCSIKIGYWTAEDDPIIEHERWSPSCPYVRQFLDPTYKIKFCCDSKCFMEPRMHVDGIACNRCKCYNYCKCYCATFITKRRGTHPMSE